MIHVSRNERFNQFFLCYIGIQIIKLGWKIVGKLLHFGCYIYIHDYICIYIPVVPHKAVAEVSEIGNL